MTYYCYALMNEGEPFYIGKGKGQRAYCHVNRSNNGRTRKDRKIQKLLREGGEITPVILLDGLSEEEAFHLEHVLIHLIGRTPRGPLLNMTDGGEGVSGLVFSEQHRLRIARSAMRPCKEETKRKISRTLLGHVHSGETRKKLRKTPEQREAVRKSLTGRKFTENHKKNLSEAQRRRWMKKEEQEKASERMKQKWRDPKYREEQSAAHRKEY